MEIPSIFLNRILVEVAKKNAVNLHLAVGSLPVMKIDDQLVPMEQENIVAADTVEKIIDSFLSEEEKQELKEKKELVLAKTFAGSFRFRVNIFFQKSLPSLTFHNIPANIKNFSDLKLPDFFNQLVKMDSGLFIIAGAHSSGKTTTAASLIEEINKTAAKRIITLEDPIEFLFVSKKSIIEQRQIGKDANSFADGIDNCLREDADIVYISEVKEGIDEVMPAVLNLASGNSLVFLEMNADNSVRVIEAILAALKSEMSAEAARYGLADILIGIIVQKLIPRVGGGMSLAREMFLANSASKSLIREGRIYQLESIIQTSRRDGMISMAKNLEELSQAGEIKDNFRINLV